MINYSITRLVALNSTVMFGALALHAIGQEVSPTPERAGRAKIYEARDERAGGNAVSGAPGYQHRSSNKASGARELPSVVPSASTKSVSTDDGTHKSPSLEQKKNSPQTRQSPSTREGEGKKKSVSSDQKKESVRPNQSPKPRASESPK